ncbi:hypothetical protein MCOR27_002177 [Pyricularia oryzae]|uniref:Uncharacterized protein n=1 Tax=Pyricularia oryzae TaxID=318829 RepID=A0A4P7NS27_PYROR|nr:hypothetical protein MCOR26_007227 [Pyricularia oryzae]KAI6285657.1 hypothetical protein MCOR27_002177 [Pyricularia oryzae]KAI6335920.1 hypothetical protein MCOR30_003705 [Pyricularia oryzae]KAI6418846.1 hypothetical protein MCOR24_005285 [Pyricularia oryzae]KAI6426424.1 hypothetical protein MCOR21_006685 [Pyricularia oryzae]
MLDTRATEAILIIMSSQVFQPEIARASVVPIQDDEFQPSLTRVATLSTHFPHREPQEKKWLMVEPELKIQEPNHDERRTQIFDFKDRFKDPFPTH